MSETSISHRTRQSVSWLEPERRSVTVATLHGLAVRGFKSIRELDDFEVRRINVFMGANGAGKSNLLDVFRPVSELACGRWRVH